MSRIRSRRRDLRCAVLCVAAGVALAAGGSVLESEEWVNVYDAGVGTDYVNSVAIDSAGNVASAEYMAASPVPGSDGAVVRFLRDGTVDWVKVLDNTATDAADSKSQDCWLGVCFDPDDDVVVGGSWSGDYYGGDWYHTTAIVRKYGAGGDFAWEWKGSSAYEAWSAVRAVACDSSGNVYAAGSAFNSWGPNQTDWAIWKFDSSGTLQSGYPIFYNYSQLYTIADIAFGIAVGGDRSFVVVGVRGQADHSDSTKRDLDWHVRKYGADGSFAWEDTFAGAAHLYDYARSVAIDASGDVYVAGYTNVGTDNSAGLDWDGLLVKYDGDTGARLWTQPVGAGLGRHDVCYAVATGPAGKLFVGRTQGALGTSTSEAWLDRRRAGDGTVEATEAVQPGASAAPYSVAWRNGLVAVGGTRLGPSSQDCFTALYQAATQTNAAPVLDAPPTASVATAAVGEVVSFHASATDTDGDPLTFTWDFGDGATGSGTDPQHAFAAAGARHVVVTVSDGKDPATGAVDLVVGEPMRVPSVSATVDFRRPGRDTLTLTGRIKLPAGFAPRGRRLDVDVGGVARSFVLDRAGRATRANGSAVLTYLKPQKLWSLTARATRGAFAAPLADEGVTNRTAKRADVRIKAVVVISGQYRCAHLVDEHFTATKGRSGTVN